MNQSTNSASKYCKAVSTTYKLAYWYQVRTKLVLYRRLLVHHRAEASKQQNEKGKFCFLRAFQAAACNNGKGDDERPRKVCTQPIGSAADVRKKKEDEGLNTKEQLDFLSNIHTSNKIRGSVFVLASKKRMVMDKGNSQAKWKYCIPFMQRRLPWFSPRWLRLGFLSFQLHPYFLGLRGMGFVLPVSKPSWRPF
jgi:hypothetical protein